MACSFADLYQTALRCIPKDTHFHSCLEILKSYKISYLVIIVLNDATTRVENCLSLKRYNTVSLINRKPRWEETAVAYFKSRSRLLSQYIPFCGNWKIFEWSNPVLTQCETVGRASFITPGFSVSLTAGTDRLLKRVGASFTQLPH